MPVSNDPTVFPCGRGNFPGTQGTGGGGQEPTVTPPIIVPKPSQIPVPPFLPPTSPPPPPAVKCVEISPGQGAPDPDPGFRFTNLPYRQCMPCDGLKNTITDPRTGLRIGDENNPSPGDRGCIFVSIDDCKPNCLNPQERIREPGDVVPPPTTFSRPTTPAPPGRFPGLTPASRGPITGGNQFFRCEVVALGVCPGEEGLSLNEATITTVFTECRACSPNIVNPNGSVEPDPTCTFSSLALCEANCQSPTFTNLQCPPEIINTQTPVPSEPTTPFGDPIVIVPFSVANEPNTVVPGVPQAIEPQSPSLSINANNQAAQITTNQQAVNGNIITANEIVENEDFRDIQARISKPVLFDPDLNFFRIEPNLGVNLVSNSSNLKVFNTEVAEEVSEILSNGNSNMPWNEVTLQNLSDDKLLISLNPLLANSFQYLRYPGGQPIGVSTLLNVVRKHILEGTIDEFDPDYYINSAQAQLESKFDVLEKPVDGELSDRLAIKFLTNSLNTYQTNKRSTWRNFQINRVRPLNEDVDMELDVELLNETSNDIVIENDGFDVDRLTPVSQVTSPIFGSTTKLNIGDGGGYYISGEDIDGDDVPVFTDNLIEDSYYAPASTRMKVLELLDVDSSLTITASSLSNQHEFVSGDSGPSSTDPLFFALNVTSVNGDYTDNPLIESYSGTYARVTDSSDIATYVNNHALSIPMLCVDYRDPIYRYILDTSSLNASLKDFNLAGFEKKGFPSIGSRFVKNIPFGFIVTPVAGGKFNPFNGGSTLDITGDIHVRSLSVIPVTDASIDTNQTTTLESFSLNLEDGVDRIGIGEESNTQNIGYKYNESSFTDTFYNNGEYTSLTGAPAITPRGTAYMLSEVIDYLSGTYNSNTFTWFDVFSRMPITKVGEMFYDTDEELLLKIANGFRGGITLQNIESGFETTSRLIASDSKTIVSVEDRRGVTTVKI